MHYIRNEVDVSKNWDTSNITKTVIKLIKFSYEDVINF